MTKTLHIMSTLAVEVAFKATILPGWTALGHEIEINWNPTAVLMRQIRAGQGADVVVLIDESLQELAQAGIVDAATITPIAQAGFGLGVRAGTAAPDISTPEAFRNALVNARAVAYSQAGASGIYFSELIQRLGIAEIVNKRAVIIPAGFTSEKLLTGEADLAVQQVSELMSVEGVDVAGPFPPELQKHTDFSAAIFTKAADRELAEAFIAHLSTPQASQAYDEGGLRSRLGHQAR